MNYFLIYQLESGLKIKWFRYKNKLIEYLDEFFTDSPVEWLDYVPENLEEFCIGQAIVIEGKLLKPKGVNIIKSYEI